MLKYAHESFNWDSAFTVPQFDFYFKVALPKKQKEREITQRDYWGRIITSEVPNIDLIYKEDGINYTT